MKRKCRGASPDQHKVLNGFLKTIFYLLSLYFLKSFSCGCKKNCKWSRYKFDLLIGKNLEKMIPRRDPIGIFWVSRKICLTFILIDLEVFWRKIILFNLYPPTHEWRCVGIESSSQRSWNFVVKTFSTAILKS